jgi:hypothetical protein
MQAGALEHRASEADGSQPAVLVATVLGSVIVFVD